MAFDSANLTWETDEKSNSGSMPRVDLAALATAAVPVIESDDRIDVSAPAVAMPSALDRAAALARNGVVAREAVVELDEPTSAVPQASPLVSPTPPPPAPVRSAAPAPKKSRAVVGRRRRPRVRRVRRVIRSIDTWTVFKVSTLFYLVAYAIVLVAAVLLWNLAYATGTIENLQNFFTDFGWQTFQFEGGQLFHSLWIIGLFLVVAGIGLNVTLATIFNLISDLVGGIGVTVLEEEVRVVPQASPSSE